MARNKKSYWRELGLPGPIFQISPEGKKRNPYRVYRIWDTMMKRGKLRKNRSYWSRTDMECYAHCTVCDEWRYFPNFYRWAMAHGYRDDLTIDRIDNERGYSPDNCRWATWSEQNKNRRMTPKQLAACRANARLGGLATAAKRRAAKERVSPRLCEGRAAHGVRFFAASLTRQSLNGTI